MAERILLINPIRRKKRAKPAHPKRKGATKRAATMAQRKRRRTAAQKAATRRLVALNRARRKPAARRRRSNPITPRAAAYRAVPMSNPIKRRRRRRSAVASHSVRRRRRNPIVGRGLMGNLIMPAITATTGALALDLAWGYLPIPANFKTGAVRHVAKAAGAILLAVVAGKVISKKNADAMGLGALTVVFHDAAKEVITQSMPTLKMGDVGMYTAGMNGLGYYSAGMPAGQAALPSLAPSMAMYTAGYSGSGLETEAGYVYQ